MTKQTRKNTKTNKTNQQNKQTNKQRDNNRSIANRVSDYILYLDALEFTQQVAVGDG